MHINPQWLEEQHQASLDRISGVNEEEHEEPVEPQNDGGYDDIAQDWEPND